jgi:hypothetical protein
MRVIHMLLTTLLVIFVSGSAVAKDLLPSWNDRPTYRNDHILVFILSLVDGSLRAMKSTKMRYELIRYRNPADAGDGCSAFCR